MNKIIKRIISFVIIFCLLFLIVFTSFNRPKVVKASVVGGVALGVGALTAIIGSYFAASGVSLNFDGSNSSGVDSFYKDIVASHGGENSFFDQYGNLTDDSAASLILGGVGGSSFWIFSKSFTAWLESLKSDYVESNNLTTTPKTLSSETVITYQGSDYPVFKSYSGSFTYPQDAVIPGSVLVMNGSQGSKTVNFGSYSFEINFEITTGVFNGSVYRINNSNGTRTRYYQWNNISMGGYSSGQQFGAFRFISNGSYVGVSLLRRNVSTSNPLTTSLSYNPTNPNANSSGIPVNSISGIRDITVEGALTDGYSDFEDAINQDLASENDDLVVGLDVGSLEGILTGQAAIQEILERIYSDTLVSEYEGVFENQEEAEKELDSNEEVVSPEWSPSWVVVNGLEDFFPFCIPFDLYEIIRLLNVSPQAPRFTWRLGFGSQFEPYDVDIDLSSYETVARVFRIMAIIGFIVFLTLKTRDLIRG